MTSTILKMTPRVYLFVFMYVRCIVYGCEDILYRAHGSVLSIISQKSFILGFFFFFQSLLPLTLPSQSGWPARESLIST